MVRFVMEKDQCKRCGKVIEGYTKNHVEHLMSQHNLKHEREDKSLEKEMKGGDKK